MGRSAARYDTNVMVIEREQEQMKESGTRKVELFDTSLRDGLQQPNLEISVPNAVSLLQRMGSFGVRYAEIGFAGGINLWEI